MSDTETDVKKIIADICGVPLPTSNDTALCDLGFNDDMCSDLANELNTYVKKTNSSAQVNDDEITSDQSIQHVIDMVNQKIKS